MFLAILTLITALSISAVAIYYSVAGLVAIFAAAAIPIIIMGGVLEVGKLVTAVWLHRYWHRATWWLKTYLSTAVIVLMFITSMGIFGFLSKAHIEQTSAAGEGVAQIEQVEKEIARQQAVIARAEQIVETTQTSGTGADQNIQSQIDREQERIDTAYDRVQPAIDATRAQLESDKQFYLNQLPGIDEKLAQFETLSRIDTNDEEQVKRLQALVGARPDGAYGGGTARAVKAFKEGLEAERTDILAKVEELKANSAEEIARLRSRAESEIDDSNKLITRLRSQLGTSTGEDIDAIIDEQNARIKTANAELDTLTEEKFQLEAQYRALEAEVGPIKYIAEFIYGEQADKNLLEEAVRWVIIVIIVVFDPLAVLLLIASQYTFGFVKEGNNAITKEEEDESDSDDGGPEDPDGDGPPDGTDRQGADRVSMEQGEDIENYAPDWKKPLTQQQVEQNLQEWDDATKKETQGLVEDFNRSNNRLEQVVEPYLEALDVYNEDRLATNKDLEEWNHWVDAAEKEIQKEQREQELLEQEESIEWNRAKKQWKLENPNETLKEHKEKYVQGEIAQVPWATYVTFDPKKYIMKEDDHQVAKTTKPVYTEVIEPEGYTQNAEQSEETLWKRIQRNNEQD